ncbi:MAG: META domain-containing protein [Actinomycetota bacterium]
MADRLRSVRSWRLWLVVVVGIGAACGDDGGAPAGQFGPIVDDASTTTARAADPSELSGSDAILIDEWAVSDYMAADGSFRSMLPDTSFTFAFSADGTVAGSSGCQTYTATFLISGRYEEPGNTVGSEDDGQIIAMGNFDLDESAACPTDVQEQIDDVVSALDRANRWTFTEPSFILRDSRGTNVIVASRAG